MILPFSDSSHQTRDHLWLQSSSESSDLITRRPQQIQSEHLVPAMGQWPSRNPEFQRFKATQCPSRSDSSANGPGQSALAQRETYGDLRQMTVVVASELAEVKKLRQREYLLTSFGPQRAGSLTWKQETSGNASSLCKDWLKISKSTDFIWLLSCFWVLDLAFPAIIPCLPSN